VHQQNIKMTSELPPDKILTAASLTAKAFLNSPSYMHLFPDESTREQYLIHLFRCNFWLLQKKDKKTIRTLIDESGVMKCCFILASGGEQSQYSTWDKVRAGIFWFAIKVGYATTQRLLFMSDYFDEKEREVAKKFAKNQPFLSLQRMGVHPDFQGQGIGTKMLKSMFAGMTTFG
jgi:ribosomal protein S18 acetylase RimI-like enzyme